MTGETVEGEAATGAGVSRGGGTGTGDAGQGRTSPFPHPDVSVRTARGADAGRLAELLAGGALTAKEDPGDVAAYAEALADIGATPGNSVLVAEVDGRVVGLCQLIIFRHLQERGGWCAEVESVHVDANLRSGGIGTALMADALRRAEAAGCYRLQLTSNVVRTDAQRWYRRLGFTPSHVGFKYVFGEHGGADNFAG